MKRDYGELSERYEYLIPWLERFGRPTVEEVRSVLFASASASDLEELSSLAKKLLEDRARGLLEIWSFAAKLADRGLAEETVALVEAILPVPIR